MRRAFTLVELLTVIAIVALLAAILYPVFASANASARKVSCLSGMRQVHAATTMYLADYGDMFMPVNHRPGQQPNSRSDRTWVQILLPYVKNFSVFNCPGDTSLRPRAETTFDEDLVPGDTYSQYYQASMRVNFGYNYLNLAPVVRRGNGWVSEPKNAGSVGDPAKTLLFVDTVWSRGPSGEPVGGGNWISVPPCRYRLNGVRVVDDFGGQVYAPYVGWNLDDDKSVAASGNVWGWHRKRANFVSVGGNAMSVPLSRLKEGCRVTSAWGGEINNSGSYVWDMN